MSNTAHRQYPPVLDHWDGSVGEMEASRSDFAYGETNEFTKMSREYNFSSCSDSIPNCHTGTLSEHTATEPLIIQDFVARKGTKDEANCLYEKNCSLTSWPDIIPESANLQVSNVAYSFQEGGCDPATGSTDTLVPSPLADSAVSKVGKQSDQAAPMLHCLIPCAGKDTKSLRYEAAKEQEFTLYTQGYSLEPSSEEEEEEDQIYDLRHELIYLEQERLLILKKKEEDGRWFFNPWKNMIRQIDEREEVLVNHLHSVLTRQANRL